MARDSLHKRDRRDEGIGGGTLTLVAEKYVAQEDHKLHVSKFIQANIGNGGCKTSVVFVYRGPGLTPAEGRELFRFLNMVARFAGKLLILGFYWPSD